MSEDNNETDQDNLDDGATEEVVQRSPLEMTDDELDGMDLSLLDQEQSVDEDDKETDDEDDSESGESDSDDDAEQDQEGDASNSTDEESDDNEADGDVTEKDDKDDAEQDTDNDDGTVDYKTEHEKLLAPFTANGRKMQVSNVDDAIRLMQMGANYEKKMSGLKPVMKIARMLENNGLLDENKLSYLIDLDKKDPAAINKLIKDSNINPNDIDVDSDTEYQPNDAYTVTDGEVRLQETLSDIRDTDSYNTTLDIVNNKWDDASREVLVNKPDAIAVINEHVSLGIYEQINEIMQYEKTLGRFPGKSDLEIYTAIGDRLNTEGAFKAKEAAPAPVTEAIKPKKSDKQPDANLARKRKAASSPKSAAKKKKSKDDFDPLAVSDEEFEKSFSSMM